MSVADHVNRGAVTKQRVHIVTVDTSQRIIKAALKDGGGIDITVWDVPPTFRWPKVGETWLVRYDQGYWFLDSHVRLAPGVTPRDAEPVGGETLARRGPGSDKAIEELNEGDTMVTSAFGDIYLDGKRVIIGEKHVLDVEANIEVMVINGIKVFVGNGTPFDSTDAGVLDAHVGSMYVNFINNEFPTGWFQRLTSGWEPLHVPNPLQVTFAQAFDDPFIGFQGNWTNAGATTPPYVRGGATKDAKGRVTIYGDISNTSGSTALGTTILQMPVSWRAFFPGRWLVSSYQYAGTGKAGTANNSTATLFMDENGNLKYLGGGTINGSNVLGLSLDGVSYWADTTSFGFYDPTRTTVDSVW